MGSLQREEKDFVKLLVLVSREIRLVVVVVRGAGLPQQRSGWAGGLLSGGEGGDVGLSGSLAGRDTTPCDWGRARVSERGQERGDGGSRGVRWRPV